MSVILRLLGVSSRATSYDIRKFFVGIDIPQGGVCIIGGPDGEAFVDVATWDHAYQALQKSGLKLKDSTIQLSVVTSEEKQQALENCQKVKDSTHGRNGTHEEKSNEGRDLRSRRKHFYLRVEISDFEPTQTDIRYFFEGVDIKDMVFSKDEDSTIMVVILMFSNRADATEGFNRYKHSKILHILWSSEKEWLKYGGRLDFDEDDCISSISGKSRRRSHSRSPQRWSRSPRRHSRSPQRYKSARRRSRSPQRHTRSPQRYTRSPHSSSHTPQRHFRSPPRQSEEHESTNAEEFHVHLMNLSHRATRDDVRKLFNNHVCENHIVFLYDEKGHRTRECFVTFTRKEHFREALALDNAMLKGHRLNVSLISRSNREKLLSLKGHCNSFQAYIYLRNFSPDVTKSDVKEFFVGFSLNEDDIFLLFDKNNTCLGDVLVKLSSLEETYRAEKLDRMTFRDRRIPIKVVDEDRLPSFLSSNGLHMMSIDLNDCVTQEDDPSEDEVTKENDIHDNDEPITQDIDTPEDHCAVQKDSPQECVSQADD
ncbi:RNA-binding protein 12B-B-like [Pyxicephalus adspersus]|uniref:RNA-binding protein 12B-B-like n=1 Tax=Pyxicephalus adspersus TaxID=30357 RepID=UPI003B5D0262